MNLFKGIVAIVCLGLLTIAFGVADVSDDAFFLLALSGLVGICLGDTLYFLTIKDASDNLSYYWHRAFLIDFMQLS